MSSSLKYTAFCFKTATQNASYIFAWIISLFYFIFVDNNSTFVFIMASYALLFDSITHSVYPYRFILPVSLNSVIIGRLIFNIINCLVFVILLSLSSSEICVPTMIVTSFGICATNLIITFLYSKKKKAMSVFIIVIMYMLIANMVIISDVNKNSLSLSFAILIAVLMNSIAYFIAKFAAKRQQF